MGKKKPGKFICTMANPFGAISLSLIGVGFALCIFAVYKTSIKPLIFGIRILGDIESDITILFRGIVLISLGLILSRKYLEKEE
jgi:hypothetical protein